MGPGTKMEAFKAICLKLGEQTVAWLRSHLPATEIFHIYQKKKKKKKTHLGEKENIGFRKNLANNLLKCKISLAYQP